MDTRIYEKYLWKKTAGVSVLLFLAILCMAGFSSAAVGGSSSNASSATNLMVDISATTVSNTLHPGYSALLQISVKNNGGRDAEDVTFYLYDGLYIDANSISDLDDIGNGETKTVYKVIKADEDAVPGLYVLSASATFDSFDSSGTRKNNDKKYWEIPIQIYPDPIFQIKPENTEYFKDTLGTLKMICLSKNDISDVTATLSSSCITVIGPSRQYLGNVKADEDFPVEYEIKPSEEGACDAYISLSYLDGSGNRISDNMSFGINVKGPGVDFKVMNISYPLASPGDKLKVRMTLKNIGEATAEDTTVALELSDPFVPVDTTEIYVGDVAGGETIDVTFNVAVSWNADIEPYSLPLTIEYEVGGTSYSSEKDMGIDVTGKIILEVISVESSGSLVKIDIANIGTRAAESVKATLTLKAGVGGNLTEEELQNMRERMQESGESDQISQQARGPTNPLQMMTGGGRSGPGMMGNSDSGTGTDTSSQTSAISYKSDIKSSKQSTFTFDMTGYGDAILTLEYAGLNNERVTQTEEINLGGSSSNSGTISSFRSRGGGGTGITDYLLYGVVILLVLWAIYRKRKGEPVIPEKIKSKIHYLKNK